MTPFITTPAAATQIITWGIHLHRCLQPLKCLVPDVEGNQNQGEAVDKRGQNPGPVVAKGLARAARPALQVHCPPGHQQSDEVGEVVPGFGEQRQTVGTQSGDHQQHDIGQRHCKRDLQQSRGFRVAYAASMNVHSFSLKGAPPSFNLEAAELL